MNYENYRPDWNKPSIFTAQQYGTKISVEVERSDMDLDEVMDAFQTLIIGLGYHQDAFKKWVIERAEEYNETDAEELKEKLEAWKFDNDNDIVLRHQYEDREELEDDFFGKWDEGTANKRMDVIGQNGNDGLHYEEYPTKCYCGHTDRCDCGPEDGYLATQEDEDEFDDYGKRIHPTFEWGDEPEDDEEIEALFDGDEWEANENLKAANERYKSEVKKMNNKKKRQSKD